MLTGRLSGRWGPGERSDRGTVADQDLETTRMDTGEVEVATILGRHGVFEGPLALLGRRNGGFVLQARTSAGPDGWPSSGGRGRTPRLPTRTYGPATPDAVAQTSAIDTTAAVAPLVRQRYDLTVRLTGRTIR